MGKQFAIGSRKMTKPNQIDSVGGWKADTQNGLSLIGIDFTVKMGNISTVPLSLAWHFCLK